MKVLVTGGNGQLGRALSGSVPDGALVEVVDRAQLDIRDSAAVDAICVRFAPNVIINAAAYTAVDAAESDPATAQAVNAEGPMHLARAAARSGARLLHVSTDYVFSGDGTQPYSPAQPTQPLGVYGRSKLDGEEAVLAELPTQSMILRTAWVYSPHGRNFLKTMLRLMAEKNSVRVVADQRGAPTAAHSIAEVLWACARLPALHGIHHWTDGGEASWHEFAVAIAEDSRAAGLLSRSPEVTPIPTSEYPTPARRPSYSVLDCTTTIEATGISQVPWRTQLRRVLGAIANA